MGIYTCSICGTTAPWDESTWAWFGSILDLEETGLEKITITCSTRCRVEFEVPFLEVT